MSFNTSASTTPAPYSALAIGRDPVPFDGSCLNELYYQYPSNSSATVNSGIPSFNGVEMNFDMRVPSNCRVRLDKSYVQITGHAGTIALDTTAIPVSASIPWNSYTMLNKAEIQLNQSTTILESVSQQYGDGIMVKMLTRYSKQALESKSDRFFTPCIESRRDISMPYVAPVAAAYTVLTNPATVAPAPGTGSLLTTAPVDEVNGLSPESAARSANWLNAGAGAAGTVSVSKNLYFSDMFDSCNVPSAFFLQFVRLRVTPKQVNEIIFDSNIPATPCGFWITSMTVFLSMTQLTEGSIAEQIKLIQENQTVFQQSFAAYDAKQTGHESGGSQQYTAVKNLQAFVTLIKSTAPQTGGLIGNIADRRNGVNQYQYVYGFTLPGATATTPAIAGVSQYQYRYQNTLSPQYPVSVALTAGTIRTNTNLYALYQELTSRTADKELAPVLSAHEMLQPPVAVNGNVDGYDTNPYVMFAAQFFPDEASFHSSMAGGSLDAVISGGGPTSVIYVQIRTSLVEIRGDTMVYVLI